MMKRKNATRHSPFIPRKLERLATRSSLRGFTLIELLIVVTISAFLSGLVILYSSVGRNEVALSVQATTVAQLLGRARALAVATYANVNGAHICAYGIVFDVTSNTYSLVGYGIPAGSASCPDAGTVRSNGAVAGDLVAYSSSTSHMSLGEGVRFNPSGANPLSLVLFYPPDPSVLLSVTTCASGDAACRYTFTNQSGNVYLATSDGAASNIITVGLGGQISW